MIHNGWHRKNIIPIFEIQNQIVSLFVVQHLSNCNILPQAILAPKTTLHAPDMFVHDFASPCTFSPEVNDLHHAISRVEQGPVVW